MAGVVDIFHHDRAPHLARIVDDDVTEAQKPLGNAGPYGDVLDFAQGDVARRASNQARVNLQL